MTVHFGLNKILAALVQVVLIAMYMNHYYSKWSSLGRDAFLNYQAGFYDRHMGPASSPMIHVVAVIVVVTFAIILYEGLSAAFAKILPAPKP
jgi:hypothetical protein